MSPFIFGVVIDGMCILWQTSPCQDTVKGKCLNVSKVKPQKTLMLPFRFCSHLFRIWIVWFIIVWVPNFELFEDFTKMTTIVLFSLSKDLVGCTTTTSSRFLCSFSVWHQSFYPFTFKALLLLIAFIRAIAVLVVVRCVVLTYHCASWTTANRELIVWLFSPLYHLLF